MARAHAEAGPKPLRAIPFWHAARLLMRRFATLTTLALLAGCNTAGSTLPDRPVTGVAVSPTTASLVIGQSVQLLATVTGGFESTLVTWVSSGSAAVSISQAGLATAVGVGTATVTASAGGMSATATVSSAAGAVDRMSVCDRSVAASCAASAALPGVGTAVEVRASAFNVTGADISPYCVFQWTPGAAGIVSVATSTDTSHRDALITRTAQGPISVVVSCNGANAVFTVD